MSITCRAKGQKEAAVSVFALDAKILDVMTNDFIS